jgi:IS1 family transposase
VPVIRIQQEYDFGSVTVCDWEQFVRETMFVYLQDSSENISGPGKTVEIDGSNFGKRKYHRGHHVQGQWIFGGVKRGTGRAFFVPVQDRTTETLTAVILAWIEPGTNLISDFWAAYHSLEQQGYTHQTVNHRIGFIDPDTGTQTNTTESCWRRLKVFVNPFNRKMDYIYDLAHYMFAARRKAKNVNQFSKFLHLVANTDWSLYSSPSSSS